MAANRAESFVARCMREYEQASSYELHRTEFVKEGPNRYLRVYVDKLEGGEYSSMGTDDCERISRYLSERLDEEDPIKQNYYLEVSSPGLDRPLVTDRDFERFKGRQVEIKLYRPEYGGKLHSGELAGRSAEGVTIRDGEGGLRTFDSGNIAKINLAVIFQGGSFI